jgi:hypothetical protein
MSVAMSVAISAAVLFGALACGRPTAAPALPHDILLTTADSSYWISSGPAGLRIRGAPILISRVEGRLTQLYSTDVDRSYFDAMFVGQRIYRRDLVRGDSTELFADTVVAALERDFRRRNPAERMLDPDEDSSDDPTISASATIDILDVHGPFLSYEYRTDVDVKRVPRPVDRHSARRGVLDLRRGTPATLVLLFGATAADGVLAAATAEWSAASTALATRGDSAGRAATDEMRGFALDATSFSVDARDRSPVAVMAVPGFRRGSGADPVTLSPHPVDTPPWWRDVAPHLPTGSDSVRRWTNGRTQVVARTLDESHALLSITDLTGRDWEVGTVTAPVQHLVWIDSTFTADDRRALAKAFDEWNGADGAAQVAAGTAHAPRSPFHYVRDQSSHPLRARIGAHQLRSDDADGRERPRSRLRRDDPQLDRQDGRRVRHAPRPPLGRHGLPG